MTTDSGVENNMKEPDFKQAKTLFNAVVGLPVHERPAALAKLSNDPALIARLLSILDESETDANTNGGDDGGQIKDVIGAASGGLVAKLDATELYPGDTIGAWKLVEEIGRGGMGSVFLVERSDGHFEQRAALKLLAGFALESAMGHLARERQILAALNHPNIARLLDGGATPRGRPYLVLEHVNGESIDKYCTNHKLQPNQIITLFIAVCNAVAFAHQQLVVHCDLKPSNILVTADGRPILLDFGVSRLLKETLPARPSDAFASALHADNVTLTAGGYTPRYASPEQRAGAVLGVATDVYSLGMMLAELLGVKLIANMPLDTAALNPDIAAIIGRATAAKPVRRYMGVDGFGADLQRALQHQPVAARPASAAYVGGKFLRRNWPWVLAATAFGFTVGVFSWRTMIERDNAVKAERVAREVKDYMISVFQGADPEISGQRDLPVSALLDAGRERIALRLKDQPETRAEMSGILGSVYQNIGKREQALKLFDEAIAIERRNNRPAVLAELLHKKAYTIYDMEDLPKAEPIALEALVLREKMAPESVGMVETLQLLGSILTYQGKRDQSRPFLDRALALATRVRGANSAEVGRVQLDFARHFVAFNSDGIDGEKAARRAVEIFKAKFGVDHYLYVDALEALSVTLSQSGKFDEAMQVAKEMSTKRAKFYGEVSNQNVFALFSYASVLDRAGQRLEAVDVYKKCITLLKKVEGGDALALANPMIEIAKSLVETGDYEGTLDMANQVIAIYATGTQASGPNALEAKYLVGRSLRQLGRLADAEKASTLALREREANVQFMPEQVLKSKFEMVALARAQNRIDAAQTLLATLDPKTYAKFPSFIEKQWFENAQSAVVKGAYDDALKLLARAEASISQRKGATHPDAWLAKLDRAELLAKQGQRETAQALAKQITANAKPSIAPSGDFAKRLAKLGG